MVTVYQVKDLIHCHFSFISQWFDKFIRLQSAPANDKIKADEKETVCFSEPSPKTHKNTPITRRES